MFFSLIKSIVPLHVLNDDRFPLCRQTFIGTKLNPFKEKLRKFQKTKSKLESLINKEFVFLVNRESPRKKALKKSISELQGEKVDLEYANEQVLAKVEVHENESSDKSQEIQSLEARLAVLEKEKISLNQCIKGLKSGSARKLNIPAASTSTKRKVTETSSRGTMTTIEVGTKSSGIVILHQQVGKSCFKGKRFSGSNDSQKKCKFVF